MALLLAACGENAVVFAPTPAPPDRSPLRYTHPGGAFSLDVPRDWAAFTQNEADLSTAALTPPGEAAPLLRVAVINLAPGAAPESITDLMNLYQERIRPDARRYTEQDRQALGDGSWRLTGLRRTIGDLPQPVNTFIVVLGSYVGIVEVDLPQDDPARLAELEAIANTLALNPAANLQPAGLEALTDAAMNRREVVNLRSWTAQTGVYFLTGEIANRGSQTVTDVGLRVVLETGEGDGLAEALDTAMGYGIPPGAFAPFSLRFGQGQPAGATRFRLEVGSGEPVEPGTVVGSAALNWTDERTFTEEGHLLITGTVTNVSERTLRDPVATVTVFDAQGGVIAAGFVPVVDGEFAPEESAAFTLRVPEYGGVPAAHMVNVQALAP